MKLKILTGYVVVATLGVILAAPAFAQNVSQHAEAQLQHWIAKDPRLQADPGLMNDPTYLKNHPNFAIWLQQHPGAHKQVEQMGAYDKNHQWRNTNWWQHNDPDTMYKEHPDWVKNHPEWRNNGDWDDQNHWHDSNWYREHRQDWVKEHHPEWAKAKEHIEEKLAKHHQHHDHDNDNNQH